VNIVWFSYFFFKSLVYEERKCDRDRFRSAKEFDAVIFLSVILKGLLYLLFFSLPFSSDFQYNNKQKKAQNNEENFSLPRIVLDDVNPFSNLISQNGRHDEERPPSIIKDPLDVEWNC